MTIIKRIALLLAVCLLFTGCSTSGDALVKKSLEAIAENEAIQTWMKEHNLATVSQEAITKFKDIIPILKEFLAREDVQEKFKTVGLPLIEEMLEYGIDSMRLKAETLGNIIRIFAPELAEQVDAIFETAPESTGTT